MTSYDLNFDVRVNYGIFYQYEIITLLECKRKWVFYKCKMNCLQYLVFFSLVRLEILLNMPPLRKLDFFRVEGGFEWPIWWTLLWHCSSNELGYKLKLFQKKKKKIQNFIAFYTSLWSENTVVNEPSFVEYRMFELDLTTNIKCSSLVWAWTKPTNYVWTWACQVGLAC